MLSDLFCEELLAMPLPWFIRGGFGALVELLLSGLVKNLGHAMRSSISEVLSLPVTTTSQYHQGPR